jgi:hypothetical protein
MKTMTGKKYAANLEHMAEPANPKDRSRAVHTTLEDYQAIYLTQILREYAAYNADTDETHDIAMGYIEYIDDVIRNRGENGLNIYTHTDMAAVVLNDAVEVWSNSNGEIQNDELVNSISECLIELWGRHNHKQVNGDVGRQEFDAPPANVEIGEVDGSSQDAASTEVDGSSQDAASTETTEVA